MSSGSRSGAHEAVWFDLSSLIDPSIKGGRVKYGEGDPEKGHGKLADNGWRTQVSLLALQGLVNRSGPRLMYDTQFWNWRPADQTWRDIYSRRYGFQFDTVESKEALITRFRDAFHGLVVWDDDVEQSMYVACMLAALEELLPVSAKLAEELRERDPLLEVRHDLRGRWKDEFAPLDFAIDELLPRCHTGMAYSVDRLWSGMSIDALDLAVARQAFIYRCSTVEKYPQDSSRIWRIHQAIGPSCGIYGWGEPEDDYCRMASLNSNYIMCAEAPNLSFHAQVKPDSPVLRQKSHRDPASLKLEDKFYISFMTTEGDAMKIHTVFQGGAWRDPNRGKVAVNWGFQPRMADIAPAMAEYYFETMTENDYFFCGCSGAGYTYPNWMQEPETFFRQTQEYMRRADLQVMDAWIYFSRPVYDRYSELCPDCDAFVLPAGPIQIKELKTGKLAICRFGSLHYYPSEKTAEDLAASIKEAVATLECRPAFLTVFAVPNANDNQSAQGGFSPSDYLRVMEILGEDDFKCVTLEEMAWAARKFLDRRPEWANRPMTKGAQKRVGVNVISD